MAAAFVSSGQVALQVAMFEHSSKQAPIDQVHCSASVFESAASFDRIWCY